MNKTTIITLLAIGLVFASCKKDEPTTVKVGDNVLYGKYSGTEVKLDGQEYLVMREEDIMGVVVKETASA